MADFSNIPTGLKVPTQIPLDVKTIALSESVLSNLGTNNNLAFTYYEGLKVYCVEEGTTYIWKEVQSGEENTGLIPSDFTYPDNLIVFGITYSNRVFNFFPIELNIILNNVGTGVEVYKEGTQYDLRTIIESSTGTGVKIITGFNQNTNTIELVSKLIDSDSLVITEVSGGIKIEIPDSATIPGLYVNNLYVPTYEDFLAGNNKGNGSLGKPFTDTVIYTNSTTYTTTPNTAIQNALNAYVGTGTKLAPELQGQKIIVQNNNTSYTFTGDLNYSFLYLLLQGNVVSTTTNYLVNMDDSANFNSSITNLTIEVSESSVLEIQGLGFLNSGNTVTGSTFNTGRILYLKGKGKIYETDDYAGNTKYILNADPLGTANGTTGCNNDGNACFSIQDVWINSLNNGLIKIGGRSSMTFNDCLLSSNNAGSTVNTNLLSIHQLGGSLVIFDSEIYLGGSTGRTTGIQFSPNSTFQSYSSFVVRNTRFSGSCTTWFNKATTSTINFNVISCNSLYFGGTNLFNSPNKWLITFNNNTFENINIDFTEVDFTKNNTQSSINTIGNNIIEQLVRYPSRAIAAGILPVGSAFINTNGSSITTPLPTWTRDIVI